MHQRTAGEYDCGRLGTAAICLLFFYHVGVEGARAIARGLRHNRSVTYVDLRSNNVFDAGAAAFAKMLRKGANETLRTLCLDANRIGEEGAVKLGEALYNP